MYWQHDHYETNHNKTMYMLHGLVHGPLARYTKLRITHAPGMLGTFSPQPPVSDPDMHHSTCVTHVPWCIAGSLTNGFIWSRWRGKHSQHSGRMRKPQFCVSGKRPMGVLHGMFKSKKYVQIYMKTRYYTTHMNNTVVISLFTNIVTMYKYWCYSICYHTSTNCFDI